MPLYVGWTLARRVRGGDAYEPWVARLSGRAQRRLRTAALVAAVLAGLGAALLTVSPGGGSGSVAPAPAVTVAGSLAYLAGLSAWRGPAAYALRLGGWLAMVVTVAIPSQLTLVLPLVAPLVATVHRLPRGDVRRVAP